MRELVRAPYMAIRAASTRTPRASTADSHKFTQDYGFPGWLSLPRSYRHHRRIACLFFSLLGLTACARDLCVLYMHLDLFVRTRACTYVDRRSRSEKANRLLATSSARSRRSSGELGSVRLSSKEPPIWRTARSLVTSFVANDRFRTIPCCGRIVLPLIESVCELSLGVPSIKFIYFGSWIFIIIIRIEEEKVDKNRRQWRASMTSTFFTRVQVDRVLL